MNLSQHVRAQRAFEALLLLDQHAHERAELEAAGVPASAIEELYPQQFSDLLPGLKRHLNANPAKHLYERGSIARIEAQANEVVRRLDMRLTVARNLESNNDASIEDLTQYLRNRWDSLYKSPPSKRQSFHTLFLWQARWGMLNYEVLPQHSREAVDKLMLALNEAWRFPQVPVGAEDEDE